MTPKAMTIDELVAMNGRLWFRGLYLTVEFVDMNLGSFG